MSSELNANLIETACSVIHAHAEELTSLDQAIGDGDHGVNMARGFNAIAEQKEALMALPLGPALQKAGMTMVMKVGGASGPLYGSLLMSMGKALPNGASSAKEIALALDAGIQSVKQRGKSDVGAKTMLDVLVPVLSALQAAASDSTATILDRIRDAADIGLESTKPMQATKGRASYLGERSIGHLDPGARSSALLVHAVADVLGEEP